MGGMTGDGAHSSASSSSTATTTTSDQDEESLDQLVHAAYGQDPDRPYRPDDEHAYLRQQRLSRKNGPSKALLTDIHLQPPHDLEIGLPHQRTKRAINLGSGDEDEDDDDDDSVDGNTQTDATPKLAATRWPDRPTTSPEPGTAKRIVEETSDGLKVPVVPKRPDSGQSSDLSNLRRRSNQLLVESQRLRVYEVERYAKIKSVGYACIQLALLSNNFVILRAVYENSNRYKVALLLVLWSSVSVNGIIGFLLVAQLIIPFRRVGQGVPSKEWNFWAPKTWQTREETMCHWQRKINNTITVSSFLSAILNLCVTAFAPREFSI